MCCELQLNLSVRGATKARVANQTLLCTKTTVTNGKYLQYARVRSLCFRRPSQLVGAAPHSHWLCSVPVGSVYFPVSFPVAASFLLSRRTVGPYWWSPCCPKAWGISSSSVDISTVQCVHMSALVRCCGWLGSFIFSNTAVASGSTAGNKQHRCCESLRVFLFLFRRRLPLHGECDNCNGRRRGHALYESTSGSFLQ